MTAPGYTNVTVKAQDATEALIEANLHIAGTGLTITGEPKKTQSFVPAYGYDNRGKPRVWLWRVPVAPEASDAE